jgi:mannose-1-phosphate guanylyltransferase
MRMPDLWSIVLAAGLGRRLASLTGGIPKQFWAPPGQRTLLEQTLDRLQPLVPLTRTVTVIDRSQRALADARLRSSSSESLGLLLDQPADRGTAAGVALGLSEVLAMNRDAIVVLTPSDHGIEDLSVFRHGLEQAVVAVRSDPRRVVLFGVEPKHPTGDYGWITAHGALSGRRPRLRAVRQFVEKPDLERAGSLLRTGAVWNTMMLVARASALVALFERHLPQLWTVFATAQRREAGARAALLSANYETLPRADFSHDLMTPSAAWLSLYTWPASFGWSDLGTPERLEAWLERSRRAEACRAAAATQWDSSRTAAVVGSAPAA